MIDIALLLVGTVQSAGPVWDGLWTIAQQINDPGLYKELFHATADGQPGNQILDGLTQLDPEVISRQLELYGLGLPQEWTLANFTDGAA